MLKTFRLLPSKRIYCCSQQKSQSPTAAFIFIPLHLHSLQKLVLMKSFGSGFPWILFHGKSPYYTLVTSSISSTWELLPNQLIMISTAFINITQNHPTTVIAPSHILQQQYHSVNDHLFHGSHRLHKWLRSALRDINIRL